MQCLLLTCAIVLTCIYLRLHAALAAITITTFSAVLTSEEAAPLDCGCCAVQLTYYPSFSDKAILN